MTVKGRRIFNYRPMVAFAVALAAGILTGEAVYGRHLAFIVCICALAFLFILLLLLFKRTRKYFYIPLALLAGLIGITASNAVYDNNLAAYYKGAFTAEVSSEIIIGEDRTKFYVTDLRIDGELIKYDGYVYIYGSLQPDFNAGDSISIVGELMGNEHKIFDTYYAANRAKNLGYFIVAERVTKLSEGSADFPLSVQLAIKRVLRENNDDYTAGVCQALLLGDKSGIDENSYSDIAASGLAHVLAVSGLHITAVATALYFILKKLRINPKIALIAVTVITFLYSMLCSFSASSLRAVIMTAALMFSSAFGYKKDELSSLAFAGILILLFRPTALMEIGFLLSFYSVFGIFAFYRAFRNRGMKIVEKVSPKRHFGKRFTDVCALSFATNLATLPLVAYTFRKLPTLFVLSNFFVLPYVMFIYLALIALTLLSLITGVGGIVGIMRFLVYPFKAYVSAVGGLPFSTVAFEMWVPAIICYTVMMIFMSKYVFVRRRSKAAGLFAGSALSVALCSLALLI